MFDQVEKLDKANSISLVQKMFEIQWSRDLICSGVCGEELCLKNNPRIEVLNSLQLNFNCNHLENDVGLFM